MLSIPFKFFILNIPMKIKLPKLFANFSALNFLSPLNTHHLTLFFLLSFPCTWPTLPRKHTHSGSVSQKHTNYLGNLLGPDSSSLSPWPSSIAKLFTSPAALGNSTLNNEAIFAFNSHTQPITLAGGWRMANKRARVEQWLENFRLNQ